MIKMTVTGLDEVQKQIGRLSSEMQQGKALSAAINKVASKAQVEIRRTVTERYQIRADEVRGSLNLQSARSGNPADITAIINIFGSLSKKGRSLNMAHFLAAVQAAGRAVKVRGAKGTKKQLAALEKQIGFAIKRGGGIKTIPGAFVGNKGRTIFMRTGPGRLPIKPVQVIGVSQMFSSKAIVNRIMDKITADMDVEVKRAVDMILERAS